MIRLLAQKHGVVVITDSDSAGNMLRAYIKNIVGDSKITNVYIPQIKGKEKRKRGPGKEGFLGLEGMSREIIEKALEKSGVLGRVTAESARKITKTDLYLKGLSGGENSSDKRQKLLKKLELPLNLSPNAMLDVLNTLMTYEEFCEVADCG